MDGWINISVCESMVSDLNKIQHINSLYAFGVNILIVGNAELHSTPLNKDKVSFTIRNVIN